MRCGRHGEGAEEVGEAVGGEGRGGGSYGGGCGGVRGLCVVIDLIKVKDTIALATST